MSSIVYIGQSMRSGDPAVWYSDSSYAAHLLSDKDRTLCGYNIPLDKVKAVPGWHKKCGNCRNKLKKAVEAVLQPEPVFLSETVTLKVVRPVKDPLEPLEEALRRKLRNNTSWTVEITLGEKVLLEPGEDA